MTNDDIKALIERLKHKDRNQIVHPPDRDFAKAAKVMSLLLDVKVAAEAVKACEGQTLIGCAPESEYDPVTTPSNEQRAHEYGAYKAFNQCAGFVYIALKAVEDA